MTLIRRTLILAAFAGLLTLFGCRSSEPKNTTVRIAYAPVVLDLPFFLAKDTGIFERHGLNVEARVFTSANDMVNALVSGQVDAITGVSFVPVLNLEAQYPGRVRVLFHSRMTPELAYDGIVVKQDSKLKTLSDLKGRKIAVYPGTTATNLLRAFLNAHDIDSQTVEILALPPASHLNALNSGTVDALMAYEPTLTAALVEHGARRLFGSIFVDMQNPSPISVTIVSRVFERENPALVERLGSSFEEAILAIRRDPDASRKHLANYTKLSAAVIGQVSLIPDTTPKDTDVASLQAFATLMNSIGEVPKVIDVSGIVGPPR